MKYTLLNCSLLDGKKDMVLQKNMTIWIDGDKISGINDSGNICEGSEVIDLKGAYVLPGLINMHVHLAASGKAPKSEKKVDYKNLAQKLLKLGIVRNVFFKMMKGFAKNELLSGVTTLRAVGGILDFDGKLRDMINDGKLDGPDIYCANTALSVPGGHFAGSLATETESPEAAVKDIQKIHATNPDLIKLMITGGVMDASEEGEPGALRMSPEIVKAACDEAHKLGYKVGAHIESSEGLRVGLENGVDFVEHGAAPDEYIISLFKKNNAAQICTCSPVVPYIYFDREVSKSPEIAKKNSQYVFEGMKKCTEECLKNNIPVGIGTDTGCPFITHYNMWREIWYFKRMMNVSAEFALYTATLNNAILLGIGDRTGSIEEGKFADIIVCENNPLDDFSNLRELKYVFAKGKMIKDPKPRKNKKIDFELDKIAGGVL